MQEQTKINIPTCIHLMLWSWALMTHCEMKLELGLIECSAVYWRFLLM